MGFCTGCGASIIKPARSFPMGHIAVPDIHLEELPAAAFPATALAAAAVSGDCETMATILLTAPAGGEQQNGSQPGCKKNQFGSVWHLSP